MTESYGIQIEQIGRFRFVVCFKDSINISSEGHTKEEALKNFWGYVYALKKSLEEETSKLSPAVQIQLDFLKQYFNDI